MKFQLSRGALLAALLATPLSAQQGPDILVPSGSLDGVFRLVDRDGDGLYLSDGEAYDYLLSGVNTSIRNFEMVPGSNPPRLFYVSAVTEQVLWQEDTNGDGIIDPATEEHVFFDLFANLPGTTHEVNWCALDRAGALWWTNDSGSAEGMYRSIDLNGDGDAEDAGETVGVFVEPTFLTVANAPNTANPQVAATELDSIYYDASWGANGRFLVEDEYNDASLAFEDLDGDGTFNGPGEVYLFSALWNGGRTNRTDLDVNPDVPAGLLTSCNEIRDHVVDTSSGRAIYYLLSGETSATQTDAALLFRGIDANADGDVNDAGELTLYWDGSLDSAGATAEYNFIYSVYIWNGHVYLNGEWDGSPDNERVLRLDDNNADGDANDPGETVVLWNLPADKTHYYSDAFPVGTFAAPPAGLPGTYNYFGDSTCASSLPGTHNIQVGTDNFNDKPVIGNANFAMRTWGAAVSTSGLYAVGLSDQLFAGSIPLPIALNATCNVYVSWDVYIPFVTDASGASDDPLPLPMDISLIGSWTYWQAVALDGGASLGFTVSDAAAIRIGAYSYSVN